MDIYKNSIWIKYKTFSQLENIYNFISEWHAILDNKKIEDLKKIECYKDEEYGEYYTLLAERYNHLYAHFFITIYSALEYDLCCLIGINKYDYDKFCNLLNTKGILEEKLKNKKQVNFLRLICNAYKHNGGLYTPQLLKIQPEKVLNDEIQYSELNILEQYCLSYEYLCDVYFKFKNQSFIK